MAAIAGAPGQVAADPYAWPSDGPLDPRRTALIIIDMQKDFCAPGGYFAAAGGDLTPAQAIVPVIERLLGAARAAGLLVVHTREGHRPGFEDLPAQKRARAANAGAAIGGEGPLGRLLTRGAEGWDFIDALRPAPGEVVIDKPGYSAFHATDLDHLLRVRCVTALILCGVTTDVCVHSTLRAGVDMGYDGLLVEDGCAAGNPPHHQACLEIARGEGGIFGATAPAASVISALKG